MKTVGIICEYNPFHLGHERQLARLRERYGADTAIVCAMSGNFVQRGEPAVFHKLLRAEAALRCGADLILELPPRCVLRSAEGFARCGVELLDRLGAVEVLAFGSECGDTRLLMTAAGAMNTPELQELLRKKLAKGCSYGAAKQEALEELTGVEGILRAPNDILGAEYCRAILNRSSPMEPLAMLRRGDHHGVLPSRREPSSGALRPLLGQGGWEPFVPEAVRSLYQTGCLYKIEYGERALLARLRAMSEDQWEQIAYGSEGLWRKAMTAARKGSDFRELLELTHARRYPESRLRRLFLCAYLGLGAGELNSGVPYGRILGVSQRGKPLLREIRKRGTIPLYHVGEKAPDPAMEEEERRMADLYALFAAEKTGASPGQERLLRILLPEDDGACESFPQTFGEN